MRLRRRRRKRRQAVESKKVCDWKNQVTFLIAAQIDNNEEDFKQVVHIAAYLRSRCLERTSETPNLNWEEHSECLMADWLKKQFETDHIEGVYSSLADAALAEVDWHSLAVHWLEKVKVEVRKQ